VIADPGPAPASPDDGRQSERALLVRRGTLRLLAALDLFALPEVTVRTGRRADLMAVSRTSEIWIVEIKSSVEDFRADKKWPEYRAFCDRFFFATLPDVPDSLFPGDAGLIVADGYGGAILREAPAQLLAAARRKELLTRLARVGAARLSLLADQGLKLPDTF
jgi:hypothetical protein